MKFGCHYQEESSMQFQNYGSSFSMLTCLSIITLIQIAVLINQQIKKNHKCTHVSPCNAHARKSAYAKLNNLKALYT